ncbi:hypothetical protein NESM_000273400 [Novymonas esmeraldas]|uniref:Membrane-associated protein n=1 Tax=Novymonas esmeraldas TaxID=1808958 RepID=A0AAW0F6Z6_9TRYP
MHRQPRHRSPSLARLALTVVLLLGTAAASVASADVILAASGSKVPFASFAALQEVCTAAQSGSVPLAMYNSNTDMQTLVTNLMQSKSVARAYVSAHLNSDRMWLWSVSQGGTTVEVVVDSKDWATGYPTGPYSTYTYAAYSTTDKGLVDTPGLDSYPVLCDYTKTTDYNPKKGFPWWAILIIVLVVVAAAVAAAVVVYCCCCRKKKSYDDADADDEDGSRVTSRSGSFTTRSTSFSATSKGDTSSSFTSRGTSHTAGTDSQSDASSFVESDSHVGGDSTATSGEHDESSTTASSRSGRTGSVFNTH